MASRIYPVNIPLPPDEKKGWKPYPIFKGPTAVLESLSCHTSVLIKGHSPHPPHTHADEEILMLLTGEVELTVQDGQNGYQHKRLKPGQFVYYPAYFAHTLQTISEEPANYMMFRWNAVLNNTGLPLKHGHFSIFDPYGSSMIKEGFCSQIVFEGPTKYLKKFHCHTSTLTSQAAYDSHIDSYDVAIIMIEGEVETLGKRAKPNSVIFYSAGKPHGMRNPSAATAKYVVFEFHGDKRLIGHEFFHHWKIMIKHFLKRPIKSYVRPSFICFDASTVCQLECPACPRAAGDVTKRIGAGFLSFDNFKKIIDENHRVSKVELSNWGEIFLNPELKKIIQYAYKKHVNLRADNGVNLNNASDDILEALVRYKFNSLSCSIDGASQEVYSIYRIKGNFDQVIENIKRINCYKKKYRSNYPKLRWQFVAFGHNEHEITKARALAKELKMAFFLKLSWDDLYTNPFSPVKNRELIKKESGIGVADRQEYELKYGENYIGKTCHQLWLCPRINYDGKLLGCALNYWGDFGNVFEKGLESCLKSERMDYARQMLLGLKEPRNDIPCSNCRLYKSRQKNSSWVSIKELNDS